MLAIALKDWGRPDDAAAVLTAAHQRAPADLDLLWLLIELHRAAGRLDAARHYAQRLAVLRPRDPQVEALLRELGGS